jgi:hypothetical protein
VDTSRAQISLTGHNSEESAVDLSSIVTITSFGQTVLAARCPIILKIKI